MPDTLISRINLLGKGEPSSLTFTDRHGNPVEDLEITGVDTQETEIIDVDINVDNLPDLKQLEP